MIQVSVLIPGCVAVQKQSPPFPRLCFRAHSGMTQRFKEETRAPCWVEKPSVGYVMAMLSIFKNGCFVKVEFKI